MPAHCGGLAVQWANGSIHAYQHRRHACGRLRMSWSLHSMLQIDNTISNIPNLLHAVLGELAKLSELSLLEHLTVRASLSYHDM